MRYAFGDVVVDTDRYLVERGGAPQHVQPQVFEVLAHLLRNRARVVPKTELLDTVWGDRFVSESTVTSRIKAARRAVGDDGVTQGVIQTVHGRGYRWVADVDELDAAPVDEGGTAQASPASFLRTEVGATAEVLQESSAWEHRASVRAPVPQPPTPTVGRTQELDHLLELLGRGRVVTLLGPGGVGKTRLAVEAALRHASATSRNVCFVDLTRVSATREFAPHLAHVLGVELGGSGLAEPVLAEALRGRALLIVLDNFEHVLEAAPVVARLAEVASRTTWMVTSRARLRIAGEQVFEVPPLRVEPTDADTTVPGDAVVLFDQVARAVDPAFDLSTHRADIEEMCRAVDGLPLAIELAARHVRTLTPPLLRARLATRLASGTGATRDLPTRQHTIPATIDWSLELLGRREHDLFVQLGVFATPVPLESVEQVCRDEGDDLVDVLTTLCDHSLVRRSVDSFDGRPRFGLLHLLRQRALQLADGHDLDDVRRRHARWVASLLDDGHGARSGPAAGRRHAMFTEVMPDIRAAHDWAATHDRRLAAQITAALGPYWHREGHHDEGREWVRAALEDVTDLDESLMAQLHLTAGIVEWTRDQHVARGHWTRAIEQFRTLGEEHDMAYATALAAVSHVGVPEDYPGALAQCEDAIALARSVGDLSLVARTLNMKGELARVAGDDDLALAAYEEGRSLGVVAGDDLVLPLFLGNLSFLADHRGDHVESLHLSLDALQRSWGLGRRMMAAGILSQLAGALHLAVGRPDVAALLIGASDEALSTIHVERHPCDVPEHRRVVAGVRGALGDETYDRLHGEGARLPLDDAVTMAVQVATSPARDQGPGEGSRP